MEQSTFLPRQSTVEVKLSESRPVQSPSKHLSSSQPEPSCYAQSRDKQYCRWEWEEQLLYYRFVKNNKQRLEKTEFTKKYNKFQKMTQFINTKSISQCRSHHQKTVAKYGSLDKFISAFQMQIKSKEQPKLLKREMGTQTELQQPEKAEKPLKNETFAKNRKPSIDKPDLFDFNSLLFRVDQENSNS